MIYLPLVLHRIKLGAQTQTNKHNVISVFKFSVCLSVFSLHLSAYVCKSLCEKAFLGCACVYWCACV